MTNVVFANNATLVATGASGTTAPVSGTQETWTSGSWSSLPVANPGGTPPTAFHIGDPNAPTECIAVLNTSTGLVQRGAEGTTPVAHAAGATYYQVTSAGDLGSFVQGTASQFDLAGAATTAQSNAQSFATSADVTVLSTAESFATSAVSTAQMVAQAAAQSGGMTGLGYVGAMGSPLTSVSPGAPSTSWANGAVYGELIYVIPSASVNGYVTLAPWGGGSLVGTYVALYNSSGTQLGITADLSAQSGNSRGIRVAVTNWTTTPSDGKIYALYTNGTQASGAGPYIFAGESKTYGYPTPPASIITMAFYNTGPTTMPGSLTFGTHGIPAGYATSSPLLFQAFLD